MNTAPTAPAPLADPNGIPTFSLRNPMMLFGIAMFLISRYTDSEFNIPVAELVLPLMTLILAIRSQQLVKLPTVPGFTLFILLLLWVTLSNMVNGISIAGQMRNTFAMSTLFLPLFFFMLTRDRDGVMAYLIGSIVGFGLYFTYLVGDAMAHGGSIPRNLRADQITPSVPLALLILFYKKLTKPIFLILAVTFVVTTYVTFIIDARGPLLSLIMGVLLFIGARLSFMPRLALPAAVTLCLLAHFISSFFITSSFDAVANSGNDTVSNLERAYAIDYVRQILDVKPWFGDSPQSYPINFIDNFAYVAGFAEQGDKIASPHNTFLEYAVFFGYPAGFLIIGLIGWLLYSIFQNNRQLGYSLFAGYACASIIRLGAFYGFSGWVRIEWFAMIFALYYASQKLNPPAAPAPETEAPAKQKPAIAGFRFNPSLLTSKRS